MLAKCLSEFHDKLENVNRSKGDTFEVTAERVEEINGAGFGILVEAVKEPASEEKGESDPEEPEKPKRTRRKAEQE